MTSRVWCIVMVGLASVAAGCSAGESEVSVDAGGVLPEASDPPAPQRPQLPCDVGRAELLERLPKSLVLRAGCYRVEDVLLGDPDEFIIEPGVEIIFEPQAGIQLSGGKASFLGTEEAPIVLRGRETGRGYWKGLRLQDWKGGANFRLQHVVISDAGSASFDGGADNRAGLFVDDDPVVELSHVTLRGNAHHGFRVEGDATLEVEDLTLEDNDVPAALPLNLAGSLGTDTRVKDNDANHIDLGNPFGNLADVLTEPVTLGPHLAWNGANDLSVESRLTIEPGTRLTFARNRGLSVDQGGAVLAVGTPERPIEFTGLEPTRGHWRGIQLDYESLPSTFRHVVIAHGGARTWNGSADSIAGLYVADSDLEPTLDHVVFRDNASAALRVSPVVKRLGWQLDHLTFEGNELPLVLDPVFATELPTTLIFDHNDLDRVVLGRRTDGIPARLHGSHVWPTLPVPYRVEVWIAVEADGDLTIEAGTTLEFGPRRTLNVNQGRLSVGGPAAETVFTAGGAEDWGGVFVSGFAQLQNTLIERAPADADESALRVAYASTVVASDLRIERSAGTALLVDGQLRDCGISYADNAMGDLVLSLGTVVTSPCP